MNEFIKIKDVPLNTPMVEREAVMGPIVQERIRLIILESIKRAGEIGEMGDIHTIDIKLMVKTYSPAVTCKNFFLNESHETHVTKSPKKTKASKK